MLQGKRSTIPILFLRSHSCYPVLSTHVIVLAFYLLWCWHTLDFSCKWISLVWSHSCVSACFLSLYLQTESFGFSCVKKIQFNILVSVWLSIPHHWYNAFFLPFNGVCIYVPISVAFWLHKQKMWFCMTSFADQLSISAPVSILIACSGLYNCLTSKCLFTLCQNVYETAGIVLHFSLVE